MNKDQDHEWVLGIDIGGSHITAGLINMQTKTMVNDLPVRRHVDCHAPADAILNNWCETIKEVWRNNQLNSTPLGFAMPGPFDYANGVCLIQGLAKYESLYKMDIRSQLAGRLGIRDENIRFRNDAEAFLEGELFCGSGEGYQHAIGITLGTGLGSAFSHSGVTADAELSVTKYKDSIIEETVSTRGLVRNYKNLTGKSLKDAKAIADLYDTDTDAQASFARFAKDFSWFLEYFIQKESPEVLIIGGNISAAWDLFMPQVIRELSSALPFLPLIVKAVLGENAALIGGACCFKPVQQKEKALSSVTIQTS